MVAETDRIDNAYWKDVDPDAPNDCHALALELVGHGKRVLQLGPAAGHVARALVARGCRVVGIEREPAAAALLEGVADRVIVADLADPAVIASAIDDERYDVVLAGDVLEHLPDPGAVLLACRRALRPGGYLVVSLLNIAHADMELQRLTGSFAGKDAGLLDRTHLRFFTLESVHALLHDAGFVAIDLRRVITPVFETEQAVDRASVSPELLAAATADDESETSQFVVQAVMHDGDVEVGRLAERTTTLQASLDRERALRVLAECARDDAQVAVGDLEAALAEAVGHARGFEGLSQALEAEVSAMKATRSYRLLAPLRALAGRRR